MEPLPVLKSFPGSNFAFNDNLMIHVGCITTCAKIKNNIEQDYDRKICKMIIEIISQIDELLQLFDQDNILKHSVLYDYKRFLKRKEHAKQLHFDCDYIQAFNEYYKLLKDLINYTLLNTTSYSVS